MQGCLTLNLLGAAYLLFSSLQAIVWRFLGPRLAGDQPVVDAIEDVEHSSSRGVVVRERCSDIR